MVKSTDIPNGIVFRGSRNEILLMDFDDLYNVVGDVQELASIQDIGEKRGENACRNDAANVITFVHTVKGEEQMLIRNVFSILLMGADKKPLSAQNALKLGKLKNVAKSICENYVREVRLEEGRQADSQTNRRGKHGSISRAGGGGEAGVGRQD